ncbi:MAG: hypothetical protein U5O12_16670 [Rhodoferax sp.]|nr:hypothetical protein [Rhodoferax sp.]
MPIEIQIVDSHEPLETRVAIGLQADGHHLNRTLLMFANKAVHHGGEAELFTRTK